MWTLVRRIWPSGYIQLRRLKGFYSKTINHPAFPFTIHPVQPANRGVTDKWREFLLSQSLDTSRPKFVLHDGPPYANGELHVGHALNKFLKDITVRYKLLCGYNVDFIPGWDCHGLPIELKAVEQNMKCTPQETRTQASLVARKYIDIQKSSFMDWGILANWSTYYTTMDLLFQKAELDAFAQLYAKGLIYRDLLPVHWSCRARTALAESELEYNSEHISPSVYIRIRLSELSAPLSRITSGLSNVYVVVWTTTPWTVPSNEAIIYDPSARYVLLNSVSSGDLYVVGRQFSEQLCSMLPTLKLKPVDEFAGSELLQTCRYLHPIRSVTSSDRDSSYPFLPATHVLETKGTGLVHCAPCHGKEDFLVGQSFNLPMNQLVDEEGYFLPEAGSELAGLRLDKDGTAKILELLKPMIVQQSTIQHSYPYDWRTKTPVITRLSEQWFLDTSTLSTEAIEAYKSVTVIPPTHKNSMLPFISSRPRWCISRQRSWGVPIPVLIRKDNGKPIVDHEFIRSISERVAHSGTDFWFQETLEHLVPERFWGKWGVNPNEVNKSTDVFDVWFDSGLSWLGVLAGGSVPWDNNTSTVADLYLEGQDQFRGWFSSSLLLSVALQNCAPYKTLMVHGLTADSEGRKMSKSLGNVVSPDDLLQRNKGCVDILRRWAACSALDSVSTVGNKEIDLHAASYRTLRNSLRFMLGNLANFQPVTQLAFLCDSDVAQCTNVNQLIFDTIEATLRPSAGGEELGILNCTVLCWLGRLTQVARLQHYPNYRFNTLLSEVEQFLSRLSSIYMTAVKDILYCDAVESSDRRMVQTVFFLTTECLKMLLSPILPYLMEECEEAIQSHWKHDALMTAASRHCSLLERYSLNTLCDYALSGTVVSDWSTCLAAMERYTEYTPVADICESVHTLYLSILNQLSTEFNLTSTPVNPLIDKHIQLHVDPSSETAHLIKSLQILHPMGHRNDSHSELCRLFRAASVSWSAGDMAAEEDSTSHLLSVPHQGSLVRAQFRIAPSDTQCPRCLRFTRIPPAALCVRCESAMAAKVTDTFQLSVP